LKQSYNSTLLSIVCILIFNGAADVSAADKLKITCDSRDLVLDPDTKLLDIEVVNNTLLTPDKTFRDIPFTELDDLVRFRVVGEFYTEGWALNKSTLLAASSLTVTNKPNIDAVNRSYTCIETAPPKPPEKLPKRPVGKRPRKRGF
jgi:hypothetical protein